MKNLKPNSTAVELIASMPMYDFSELQELNNLWWQAIALELRETGIGGIPIYLQQPENLEQHWLKPNLLLSQTCGFPYVHRLSPHVNCVGTIHYSVPGCSTWHYSSVLISTKELNAQKWQDTYLSRFAYNSLESHSGYNIVRYFLASKRVDTPFFRSTMASGSHIASLEMLHARTADVTFIDVVTWALLKRHRPELTRSLQEITFTAQAPGLPYISSRDQAKSLTLLRQAITRVIADPLHKDLRDALFINGFSYTDCKDYQIIAAMYRDAANQGYSQIQ